METKTKLANIVGEYSADLVAAALRANNIPYVRTAGEMDVHTFEVFVADQQKAMDCVQKAMSDELERLNGVTYNMY